MPLKNEWRVMRCAVQHMVMNMLVSLDESIGGDCKCVLTHPYVDDKAVFRQLKTYIRG